MERSGFLPFSFEIIAEELNSFEKRKEFVIKSQFADVFSVELNNPEAHRKNKRKKSSKSKRKAKTAKKTTNGDNVEQKTQKGQSLLHIGDIDTLMSHMMQYPMEICLCSPSDPKERIGSTLIPWNPIFIEYLMALYYCKATPSPPVISDVHNIFDEATSKKMAVLRLTLKLCLMDLVNWNGYKVLSGDYPNTFILVDPIDPVFIIRSTTTIVDECPGIIKTIYGGGKQKKKRTSYKNNAKRNGNIKKRSEDPDPKSLDHTQQDSFNVTKQINRSILQFIRSETDIAQSKKIHLLQSKSCTDINSFRPFDYIFGDRRGPFGNRIYTVGYFTVDPKSKTPSGSPTSLEASSGKMSPKTTPAKSSDSLDSNLTRTVKCRSEVCEHKKERPLLEAPDDRVLLDITSLTRSCCMTQSVQRKMEVIGSVAGIRAESDPCYCACECSFEFERKTTYCRICKGYEKLAEDLDGIPQYLMPDPCPIYHKIGRVKDGSTESDPKKDKKKRAKTAEIDLEKDKKIGKDDRFKFNYGYKGIPPQIGHSECAMPCTGTMSNVPKYMGWLWTADNVPGLMFRPMWKPGAINKVVARMLKMAKHPGTVISKRRKTAVVKKRPLKRPLLVVHKKDGEYNVTLETMKAYPKARTINQQPYDDKPVVTYTVGRTEEENRERQKKKERAMRRLEREQREFIQNTFSDMCKEICLKTYQQALGILPDTEDPECTCFPALPAPDQINVDRSCSCSEGEASLASDTDSDEWILEFTPPNAFYDPQYPGTKVKTGDKDTQYTYLDYRVKLVDRFGNPVPRFFKGPDGKQQCSDLGGFWSPDHKWLEINGDGYVAPDGRWAPLTFFGPSGEQVDTDTGKFQAANGQWLVVGIDGYIDSNSKWKFYRGTGKLKTVGSKPKSSNPVPRSPTDKKKDKTKKGESEPTFSCFGDVTPVELSKMGIVGHGPDRKLLNKILKGLVAKGVNVKIPQSAQVPKFPGAGNARRKITQGAMDAERFKCSHHPPSGKGVSSDHDGAHYFRTKEFQSRMSIERMYDLEQQGKSLSAYHEPCFHSSLDYKKRPKRRHVIVKMPHADTGF